MSHFDYVASREIALHDYPFYAIIMAAMRQADTDNLELLKRAWPDVWMELNSRYHSPEGILPSEQFPDGVP